MIVKDQDADDYLADVAELLERFGVRLTQPASGDDLELIEDDAGVLSFELVGEIGDWASPARIELREALAPYGDGSTYQTSQYGYELIDMAGDFRRGFHFHDADWFLREYLVAVHEHCEQPLGSATCAHYSGTPIKDSYAGARRLLDAWTAGPIDCATLPCL